MLNRKRCSALELAEFIGLLVSSTPGIPYSMLYTKRLERCKYLALKDNPSNFSVNVKLNSKSLRDIDWWKDHLNSSNPIRFDSFDVEMSTDASPTGWGAGCLTQSIGGLWFEHERQYHINYLELVAAYYGLKAFTHDKSNIQILIRIDNTTAISYINRMGGIKFPHLYEITRKIWKYCQKKSLWIFASYIASKDNCVADAESRILVRETEWSLNECAFKEIVKRFGSPIVDLFASMQNSKCKKYVSWHPDPYAWKIDAFTVCWRNLFFYAFPPFNMILRVLRKIKKDESVGIVVVPHWETQPLFPVYLSMLILPPIVLNPGVNLLTCGSISHPLSSSLGLMAGLLSAKHSPDREYPQRVLL